MINTIMNEYTPDTVSHPGETLADILEEKEMSQAKLSEMMGRPKKSINEIIKGKASITPETSIQLENVLGISATFWNERQRLYDIYLARIAEKEFLSDSINWLKNFPIKEMLKYGYIKENKDKTLQLKELLSFFGIGSPQVFETKYINAIYRKSAHFEHDKYALSVWLQFGKNKAIKYKCDLYNRNRFKQKLSIIRKLTTESPDIYSKALISICSKCGVAIVFTPELPKIRVFGAVQWYGNRPIIQLCLRGKRDDILWHTFFHEAAHIILHPRKKTIFIDAGVREGKAKEEEEADKFAAELLIPKRELETFNRNYPRKTYDNIDRFAKRIGISPSIVVGQLQYNGYVDYSHFNRFRKILTWSCEETT